MIVYIYHNRGILKALINVYNPFLYFDTDQRRFILEEQFMSVDIGYKVIKNSL